MMFPLNHGVIASPDSPVHMTPDYPVSTGLVGLWDANEYGKNPSVIGDGSVLPDLSGNNHPLSAVTSSDSVRLETDYDASTPFYIHSLADAMELLNAFGGVDAKSVPFTYVIRVLYLPGGSTNRYAGFYPSVSGDPSYMLAGDNSMRFNNGTFSFPGGSGKRTLAVRHDVSGSCDVFVDGSKVADAGAVPSGAAQDRFFITDCQYVFAAVHQANLSDAEIVAIHDYSIGASP
jgi:hypothetical protein